MIVSELMVLSTWCTSCSTATYKQGCIGPRTHIYVTVKSMYTLKQKCSQKYHNKQQSNSTSQKWIKLFVPWCKCFQKNYNLVVGKHILQLQILTLIWCAIHQTNLRTIGSMMLTLMSCICCEPDMTGIVGFPPDIAFSLLDTPWHGLPETTLEFSLCSCETCCQWSTSKSTTEGNTSHGFEAWLHL